MIKANLVHIGENIGTAAQAKDPLACDFGEWTAITNHMAEKGLNMCLIDLCEGLMYESHPEIAVRGAWSGARLRGELARLRALGLEPIPKLNFSATHDQWLGEWHRMVSTPDYYRVCADLIAEVLDIFDHPRFFHLGYDEEDVRCQGAHEYVVLRQGELWWHDFLWFVKEVEKRGSRAWIWSDWMWEHEEDFLRRCPKSVLQSNWYYDEGFDARAFRWPRIKCYLDLDKAGFDQVPTGSNYVTPVNMAGTVEFALKNLSAAHLKGFLATSWKRCLPENRAANLAVIDQFAAALGTGGQL